MNVKSLTDIILSKSVKIIKKRSAPLLLKEAAWRWVRFVSVCGKSNPVSFALRPIIMHKRLKLAVGMYLVITAGIFSIFGPEKLAAQDFTGTSTVTTLPEPRVNMVTQQRIKFPLPIKDVSQNFWLLHKGVDLRIKTGTPVYPIMSGKVVETEDGKNGYGKKVVVDHENGYLSLYAHLSEIDVAKGQEITTNDVVGKSGNSGRSTGPHLHLELREKGELINPMGIFAENEKFKL
jgi:murein DD-endopeptidase MepM/ murein hydrolase activator NlpD